jgi:alanine racemase
MKKLLTWLSKRRFPYEPLITITISKDRLFHNFEQFKKLSPKRKIAPVLKSNAYGHGLLEIAHLFEKMAGSVPFLIVDSYFEAVALRAERIHVPLLIIGYTRPETICSSSLKKIAYAITSIETLRAISVCAHDVRIHLKIDTGMRRQGLLPQELTEAKGIIRANSHIILEGICSHLSDADNIDPEFTRKQIGEWNSTVEEFSKQFPTLKYTHLSNTDGHIHHDHIKANVSRLGIGLYGITSNEILQKKLELFPALEMKTIITSVKNIRKGDMVGYGKTFIADRDMTIATIPVGYFEGLDRMLSNKGEILVGPTRTPCPIVGRVSMNITTIDVSKVNASIHTPVIVISNSPKDPNSIQGFVKVSDARIPYEFVVRIPAHLKRVVI